MVTTDLIISLSRLDLPFLGSAMTRDASHATPQFSPLTTTD